MTGWKDAEPRPFWLDSPLRPSPADPLSGDESCALAVIGGGFTGLWAALQAKEDDPARDVVLLEQTAMLTAPRAGTAASPTPP
jgi:monoamine oxidase